MSAPRRNWEESELLLALNLYCRLPFGKFHSRNRDIIVLADAIGRTPGAVALKLCNFAHLDPTLVQRGASNVSKLDRQVWSAFWDNPEKVITQSRVLWEKTSLPVEEQAFDDRQGTDRLVLTKQRVNQSFFRKMILAAYNNRCCFTGLEIPELLVASHILPWADHHTKRLEPTNGLCLSAMYDKAFDCHLISFDEDYRMVVSSQLHHSYSSDAARKYFLNKEGQKITLPHRFLPSQTYLAEHREQLKI